MPAGHYLAILMFLGFIALIFTGFPVAWVLGGLAILFTALAIIADIDLGTAIGIDWSYTSISVERMWNVMENWVLVALPMFIFMGLMLDRSARRSDPPTVAQLPRAPQAGPVVFCGLLCL